LLSYKTLSFKFLPDTTRGTVNVSLDPPAAGYAVIAPKLSGGDCGDWREHLRATIGNGGATFSGTYSALCEEKTWHIHPYQMPQNQYFGMVLRQIWTDLGGVLKGEIRSGAVPQGARLIEEWESPPLPDVIRDMNKYSNNVMARQLLLTLAADVLKLPATPERGARVIRSWFANKGIDAAELVIENGSGLSRIERISAATMGRMLVAAYQSPLMPEFISSMPLVGYDGTMRQRLKATNVSGNAHIKTGTLNDVRAMAGYVLAASGKRYVVVCIINHGNAGMGRDAQDALLQWIYEKG
jgi:D-alanyl-D-alanine carboxypeptidase/D-alanyl-D-alanine-endopeptidase (penicillin-binding protein 4)